MKSDGTVYLIHFDTAYKHAKHYLGWAKNLQARLDHHTAGTGANLMRVIKEAGITWRLARTWEGDKNRERQLKNNGGKSKMCPICKEERAVQQKTTTLGQLVADYKAGNISRDDLKAAVEGLEVIHAGAIVRQPEKHIEADRELEAG